MELVGESTQGQVERVAEPSTRRLLLPFVVAGRRLAPDGEDLCVLPGTGRVTACVPPFDEALIEAVLAGDRHGLIDVPLQEIVTFLHRVGVHWKNDEYARRRLFIRQLQEIVGFSEEMAIAEADLIAAILTGLQRLYDTVDLELGSCRMLDDWIPRGDCEVRALPRGRFVHLLPGNVPISSVLSMLRSLVTKNQTIVKYASRDPVTATSLALSFLDVDSEHPVTRALTVTYWPVDHPGGERLLREADGVCVWGGVEALAWAQRNAHPEAEIVRFGPKESIAIADVRDADDAAAAGRGIAHDVCMYDQEACFSTLRVFVAGECTMLRKAIVAAFRQYDGILPPGLRHPDLVAHTSSLMLHHGVLGSTVEQSEVGSWAVVECGPGEVESHPRARTLFLHPVGSIQESVPWVGRNTQTVAIFPWERNREIREVLVRRGVARLVETGMSGLLRLGGSHDGMDPLTRFVRIVSVESGRARFAKGMAVPIDPAEMVENREFRELVM